MVVGQSEWRLRFGRKLAEFVGICGIAAAVVMLGALSPAHAAPVPERTLAGIKIFSPLSVLITKFGSPDEVRIGDQTTGSFLTDGPITIGGTGPESSSSSSSMGQSGGYPNSGGSPIGNGLRYRGVGNQPTSGSSPYPGPSNPNGSAGSTTKSADSTQTQIWVYDRPDGTSLEFTLSAGGRVIQIHLSGYKSAYRTSRGVSLGASLGTVTTKYGFPESDNISGKILNLNYVQKFHAAFQFLNQKLVGIIVAAVD